MNPNIKSNKAGGEPIRGCLDPFRETPIEITSKQISTIHAHKAIAPRGMYYDLRSMIKANTAFLFSRALRRCGKYAKITDQSRTIIDNYLALLPNSIYTRSFVMCIFDIYNDERKPNPLKPSKCDTPNLNKALQHAVKDLEKATITYIAPILEYMEDNKDSIPLDILERYRNIYAALNFVCVYFKQLFCGKLPRIINIEQFDAAKKIDSKIKIYYALNEEQTKYRLISKYNRTTYKALSQECATLLICVQHNI